MPTLVQKQIEWDAFLVAERRARTPRAAVEAVLGRLKEWERTNSARQRRRRSADQRALDLMVEALVCEAVRRDLMAPGGRVAVSLGRERKIPLRAAPHTSLCGTS